MAERNPKSKIMSLESEISKEEQVYEDEEVEEVNQRQNISQNSAIDLALMSNRSDVPTTRIPYMPQTLLEPLSGTMAFSQPPVVNKVNRAAAQMMVKSVDSIVKAGYVSENGNQVASNGTEQIAMSIDNNRSPIPMLSEGMPVGIYEKDTENSSLQTIPDISDNSALQTLVSWTPFFCAPGLSTRCMNLVLYVTTPLGG